MGRVRIRLTSFARDAVERKLGRRGGECAVPAFTCEARASRASAVGFDFRARFSMTDDDGWVVDNLNNLGEVAFFPKTAVRGEEIEIDYINQNFVLV